jgi:hypothetical protein
MERALAIAAVVMAFGLASPATYAQGYVVNGHAASQAEAQMLASHGALPGKWQVDGYGISAADTEHKQRGLTADSGGRRCWYVLDVLLCD